MFLIDRLILFFSGLQCPIYQTTGFPCFSCGMTRAYAALLQGDIHTAFFMHPLFWTIPFLLLVILLRKTRFGRIFYKKWFFIGLLIIFGAVYVIRMCILFPDTPPMNYNSNSIFSRYFSTY